MNFLLLTWLFSFFQNKESITWTNGISHDFGKVQSGWYVKHDFTFTNNTDKVLTIDNVRASCECTAPDWEEEVILPGKSSNIKVVFHTNTEGYYNKTIKVYFSKIKKPYKLTIEADVEER